MMNNIKALQQRPLKKFSALMAVGFLTMSMGLNAITTDLTVQEFAPVSPYNPAICLPGSIPVGATGTLNTNSYLSGPITTNPEHKSRLVTFFGSGASLLVSGYTSVGGGVVPIAYTDDRAKHWHYSYIPLAPCVGGSIAAFGGGIDIAYNKDGHHLLIVGGFTNLIPFGDQEYINSGHWAAHSHDDGKTWSDPVVFAESPANNNVDFEGTSYGGGGSLIYDLEHHGRAYFTSQTIEYPSTFYGNITYARTKDHGKTWNQEVVIYDMAMDSEFLATYLNTNIERAGGQSVAPDIISIPGSNSDEPILINAFLRIFPKPDSETYTQNIDVPGDSITDHVVIRSFDGGRHWERNAIQIGEFDLGISQDPTQPVENQALVFDNALGIDLGYSKKTDRVYAVWQAATEEPSEENPVPEPTVISLAVSGDKGATWQTALKVNRTPTPPIAPGGDQVFNAQVATIKDGYVAVVYFDYRNYDGSEDFVATDGWVAIYRETDSPTGGSTGVGLDFVTEIRLTAQSFNALIGYNSNYGTATGVPGITSNGDNFFINFSQTGTDNLPTTVVDGITVDPNNRFNSFSGNLDVDE